MDTPQTPECEDKRLASLQALNILDTPFEERFERITRFASQLFDVPIALVSLIDQDRQWFKSAQGLDVRETSRAISFCGHTILSRNILTTQDALSDTRFYDNPLVTGDPHIRFYAGCPLHTESGMALGTLCLIDRRPRELNDNDLEALRDLALVIEREINQPELNIIDAVTNLSNRQSFLALAEKGLALCSRSATPVSLVFIELDRGEEGDAEEESAEQKRMLLKFGEYLNSRLDQSALVARLAKNQFAVLLIDASVAEATLAVMQFNTAVEELGQQEKWSHALRFDFGIAEFNSDRHTTVEKLLADADLAMYDSKKRKRYAAMKI